MSLITPWDPGPPRAEDRPPAAVCEAVRHTVFGSIASAVASSCGSVHSVNEDAHSELGAHRRLFVVADGVGGGAMAALASRQLVSYLHSALDGQHIGPEAVGEAVLGADRFIAGSIAELTESPGAATLALCAPLNARGSKWLIAWVGDCRVYQVSESGEKPVQALTLDDSFANLHEEPPAGGSPDDPARMVGNGAVSRANVALADMKRGDLLVVCSDGVHKHVPPDDLHRLLRVPQSLPQRCEELIALARANGSRDDATVLLIQRVGPRLHRPRWLTTGTTP